MKTIFTISFLAGLSFICHSQSMTYADTISTPLGEFMLETNEAPEENISIEHQSYTAEDGGTVESVNFFPSSERRASITPVENASFSIKPNPTTDMASLFMKNGGTEMMLTISDITGRTVSTRKYFSADGNYQLNLDLSEYPAGVFFVEINSGGYHYSQKLVKE